MIASEDVTGSISVSCCCQSCVSDEIFSLLMCFCHWERVERSSLPADRRCQVATALTLLRVYREAQLSVVALVIPWVTCHTVVCSVGGFHTQVWVVKDPEGLISNGPLQTWEMSVPSKKCKGNSTLFLSKYITGNWLFWTFNNFTCPLFQF